MSESVPTYYNEKDSPAFVPVIPMQAKVIRDVVYEYDYSLGVHEVLLSGSVGSAKSLLAAHLIIMHCRRFKGAHIGIGRRSMPDLKETLLAMIIDHLGSSIPYSYNKTKGQITLLETGSKITCFSWADKKYKKFRSYAFSGFVIEELTENEDQKAYKEIIMRIGRIPHIKENWLIAPTNPDSPAHWAHDYFIDASKVDPTRHVYYSLTRDNPFLPDSYVEKLLGTMTKKEADRMLRGMWVEVDKSRIYHEYDSNLNFKKTTQYQIDPRYPVAIFFDFNVADGKPFSAGFGQNINGVRHIFKSFEIEGIRTKQMMQEMEDYGIFEYKILRFKVYGDASGKHKDTRSLKSDYDIIYGYLDKLGVNYEKCVPNSNPPLRRRHNLVNRLCQDGNGRVSFYVYAGCEWVDKGFRLTAPTKGSDLIEDDTLPQQHITTAIGYWCDYDENKGKASKPKDRQL